MVGIPLKTNRREKLHPTLGDDNDVLFFEREQPLAMVLVLGVVDILPAVNGEDSAC